MHRNAFQMCSQDGGWRCTAKSDLIVKCSKNIILDRMTDDVYLNNSKEHTVQRRCRCMFFKRRQGFSNFYVGSDLECYCRV